MRAALYRVALFFSSIGPQRSGLSVVKPFPGIGLNPSPPHFLLFADNPVPVSTPYPAGGGMPPGNRRNPMAIHPVGERPRDRRVEAINPKLSDYGYTVIGGSRHVVRVVEELPYAPVYGDTDNGCGLLFNRNRLGDGGHTVVARVEWS